jgi:SAM-dependent methyltransferase
MDFGYSIGVLHHIPDTQAGMQACANKLKPGAPFLVYLYYAFDNRPRWFIAIWQLSDSLRKLISGFPHGLRYFISQIIALFIYFPIARFSALTEKLGFDVSNFPLSAYRGYSFYTMRTDALDRFGTRLEKRFSREQIKTMMEKAGLEHVKFSSSIPYWCAVGYRKYIK